MTNKKEISAAIIIIGNEVLSGRTKDLNTSTLATWLNSLGISVGEVRVIPDVEKTIIDTVHELRVKYNYVFTTGGIGPTHDDITAESISKAFNIEYGFHKEAFAILEKYYEPGNFNDGRQKMAKMSVTANLILNPTSGAPGFYVENVLRKRNDVQNILRKQNDCQRNRAVLGAGLSPALAVALLAMMCHWSMCDQ